MAKFHWSHNLKYSVRVRNDANILFASLVWAQRLEPDAERPISTILLACCLWNNTTQNRLHNMNIVHSKKQWRKSKLNKKICKNSRQLTVTYRFACTCTDCRCWRQEHRRQCEGWLCYGQVSVPVASANPLILHLKTIVSRINTELFQNAFSKYQVHTSVLKIENRQCHLWAP